MNSKKGFTLVELLGVLVVLGLISVIIVPKVIDSITTSKEAAYQTQVETIENAAKKYGISNDLLYPKEGEKKYIAVKDLIAVGELSDKEIINPKTGNKMNGYVLVEYNSGYQQYEYTYVEEIDENALGAMGPIYEVKDPDKWTTSKNVTIIYPKGNGKYDYDYKILAGTVDINGQEYKGETGWIAATELRKNITFKTNGSLIARVKNKDEYINGSILEIEKIDNTAPSVALGYDKNTLTTNKIDLVATCTDDESGISKYLFKLGNGNWIDNGTSNKYTFSNLNNTTSYNFSVECINGVGMTNQSTLPIKLNDIDKDKDNIWFEVSDPSIWKTNKNVKIFYPANYTRYEFSIIDGTATRNGQELTPGTWYIASSLQETVNFTTEGTIAARIYDGTNLSSIANQAITYVDPTKPTCEILLTGGTLGTNGYYTVAPKVQFKTSIAGGSGIYFGQSKTNSPVYDNSVTKNNSGLINITSFSEGNNAYYGFVKTGAGNTSTCTASFKADTFKPVVAINGNASVSYANSSATITVPLKITDLTSGIDTNTFTDSDITVKVGTTTVTPTKSLKYNSVSNGVYSYTLTLSGVTGNGALNLSVGAGMVVDKAGNKNNTASISTNVIIDNTAPTLEITGTNGTTYKKESDATITLKDTGGSGLTAGSYTIKYGWATSSQTCSNLTSSTTITVAAGATSGSIKVNVKGKTGAGKLYVCNSTSITDRAKNTLSANSIVSSNMYLDNEEPQIVINPNGGSYTIPVGSTSTAVRKTITVTDSTLNKSSLKYGWSSSKDVKPTMSSSFTSGTSFNDSLSGGDNYLWITASDNLSNTTTIVSNSFNVGYSVEYNANGGTTTCSVQRKEHGKNLTLCSTTPIRSGYTFAGWSDSSTATSKKYDVSGTYTDNSSVKLYAVWKRTTTVTAATKSKVYDGKALTSNECSASNLASSHTVTCTNSGTITDVGSVTNSVNTVKITDSNGNDVTDNYSVTKVNGKLTVTKANSTNPTLTAYEGIYDATSHTFTMSGGVGGTINYSTNNGTTWTTTKPTRTTAGTTTVQVKIVGDKNHNDTSVISTTIKIDKRAITVKAAVAEKIYDGTVLTKTDGCESTTNLVSGHEAKCTNTGALLNAGSSGNSLSKVSVVSATGADVTDNYEITKEGGRLTVKPKSVAVTWGSTTTFTYNGNAQAPTASVTTGISNETMTVTRTTGTNAGSYTSTASCSSVTGGQAKCSNYTLTGNTKAFIINKVTPTIKFATTSGSVTYHTVNGFGGNWIYSPVKVSGTVTLTSSNTNYVSIQENYVSTKVDSFTSQPSSYFTIVVNGVKATLTPIPITVKFTPDNENFETVTETFNVTVNQATPKITLSEESAWLSSSKTFTEKANVSGKFTNTSGTTSVATVSPISNSTAVAANTAQTVTVTGVKDGSSTITVKFEPTDTTNYKTVSAKYTAKVDKTRPTITANGYAYSNQNGSHDSTTYNDTGDPAIHTHSSNSATSTYTYDWNNTGINFRIKFSDSGSGIKSAKWCWNDSGDYNTNTEINNCSTNVINYKQIELIAAGYRKGTFTVEDNAGNKTIYNVIVKIDKTRPTITANGYAYSNKSGSNTSTTYNDTGDPAIHTHSSNNATSSDIYDWNNTGINFRIGFSDSASGIRDARWCWDTIYSTTDPTTKVFNSTSTSKCSAGNISNYKQIDITGTGYRRGRLTVEDNAGNKTVYNVVIKIDKEEPVIKLNGSASSTSINNGSGNITIPIKITEHHSGITSSAFTASDITVKIGTTTVTPAVKSLKYNSVSNGVYSYTLTLKIGDKNVGGTVNLSIAASAIKDSVGNGNKATTLNTGVTYTTAYPTLGATATCTKTSTGYRAQISCHNCKELYYVYYNSPYPASTAALAADAKNAGTYTSRSTAGDLSKTSTYTTSSTYSRLYYGASNDKGNSVLKYVTCGS
jgi:uncharacterized repeat protein (TIGR02543 family)/prepilin-type N-terminal cleavage/methylation domain-containing protein